MDFVLDVLTEWIKEMLTGGIMGNLSGLFNSVNQQVAAIIIVTNTWNIVMGVLDMADMAQSVVTQAPVLSARTD